MPPTGATSTQQNGRSEPPRVPATRISTRNHGNGLTSTLYIGQCPRCSSSRRHTRDGLRQCGCGLVYQLIVTAVVGSEAV